MEEQQNKPSFIISFFGYFIVLFMFDGFFSIINDFAAFAFKSNPLQGIQSFFAYMVMLVSLPIMAIFFIKKIDRNSPIMLMIYLLFLFNLNTLFFHFSSFK